MVSASLLLLVIAKHPANKSFLSGKIFEYMASGKANSLFRTTRR